MGARGGSEILLDVERRRGAVVSSLQAQLRIAIRDGRLRLGEAVPATRQLAAELGISRASVVEAYARLAAEGFLESRPGSATRVAHGARSAIDGERPPPARRAATYDLRPGGPDVGLFPWPAWARAAMTVSRTAPEGILQYGDPAGQSPLRAALAAYLGRTRAVVAHPDELVVTAGVTQSLALLSRILARRGVREIGVEDPGPNSPERRLIRAAGLEPIPVPVDDEGIDVSSLAASGVSAVLVTPAHHYPGGAVLSAARRRALVRWARDARRSDRLIIEDDYDAEFRYDRQAVAALQGLAPDRVAYLGSASKLLAPGMRIGWAVPPGPLVAALAAEKAFADFGSPTIDQLILAELIEDGSLARHVRRARLAYRRRRDLALAAIERHLPGWTVRGVAAGLQLLATPPQPIRERQVVRRAWRRGIWLSGLDEFRDRSAPLPADRPTGLVIGFAMVPEAAIEPSIAALAEIVAGEGAASDAVRGLGHQRAARP